MGRLTGQWIVMGPPGMNKEAVKRYRKAFYATLDDPEYQKEAE